MPEECILLPQRGLRVSPANRLAMELMVSVGHARSFAAPLTMWLPARRAKAEIKIIDSIHEDGPKLVEADRDVALALRDLGLRLEPLITYRAIGRPRFEPKPPPGAGTCGAVRITVVTKSNRTPIRGASVTGFTNVAANEGAEAETDSSGNVDLDLGQTAPTLDRLYVHPPLAGFWGHYETSVSCTGAGLQVALEEVQASSVDALSHFYGTSGLINGSGVMVGVIDTGIDNSHGDLSHVTYGENTAKGEAPGLWQDNGTGHGTHVAGIIGGRGAVRRGLAPGVELCSFRAFPQDSFVTTNYQILKALIRAMDHGCHLINLSLNGEARPDETMRAALEDAKDRGIVVIVAAGNQGQAQVGYPAHYAFKEGLSVSAMGRKGTFPTGSHEESDVGSKVGTDADNFVARFTNTGDVSLVGPGVGIISTVPGGYGVMSGTSMASPAVTGRLAWLLAQDLASNGTRAILNQTPDASRTRAMLSLAANKATPLFNDAKVEGDGMLP